MGAGSDSYYEYLLKLWLLGLRVPSTATEATGRLVETDIALHRTCALCGHQTLP